jgi:hypothetical protein
MSVFDPQKFSHPVLPNEILRSFDGTESGELFDLGERNNMRLRSVGQHLHSEFAAGTRRNAAPLALPKFTNGGSYCFKQALSLHGTFVLDTVDVFVLNLAKSHEKMVALALCSPLDG